MIRTLAVAAALAGVVMTAGLARGQTVSPPTGPQKSPGLLGDQQLVEGTIKSVHPHGIVLEDGTSLIVPASLEFNRGQLKPGATVTAHYEERAGQKFTTTLTLEPLSRR